MLISVCPTIVIFAKAATPMNPYMGRTMFTSKSTKDFAMQNPFNVRSTQEETSQYQFFAHFTLKELCLAKLMQALDANRPLSKYGMLHTELHSLDKPCTFKGKCSYNAEIFK